MNIGVTAQAPPESRVAATPETVTKLAALGYDVAVETGAGAASRFPDEAYVAAGARIVDADTAWGSDVVLTVNPPAESQLNLMRDGGALIGLLAPAQNPEYVAELGKRNITALALDAVPRISRAQSMDVLSSMANIAGYRAVVEAANHFGRFFTGQVTAAGKVPPAKVLVAGAGVAGLAAIGAASSLGAIVRATDPRPEVADQVASIGGEYLPIDVGEQMESADGYAKATSEDYNRAAEALYAEQATDVDIIITTALIPGREAPRLITAEHVAAMKPGSVIVDMAASQGGNVEGSVAGEVVVSGDVTIIGYTDLAGRLPAQASQLYGTNLVNLLKLLTPEKDGELALDMDDPVQRGITVVKDGELMWPPPPVQVSAAPASANGAVGGAGANGAGAPGNAGNAGEAATAKEKKALSQTAKIALVAAGALVLLGLTAIAPPQLALNLTVFYLAVVIGFYVIGNVHHALHTPLMSVTNAISGIVVVGALLQVSIEDSLAIRILAVAAIFVASINIFGGFAMTRRMLGMFVKGEAR
ncbi:MAG TPA: Re/Si-specific NAD(P)(+) transhydrogenase subunit alpha [Beutenbergiaceae bacterium]|nr:Re/Si-specific NAD(P)(+) transhydrogenase subunit alpha [Beutenbergiaceae bacterium]